MKPDFVRDVEGGCSRIMQEDQFHHALQSLEDAVKCSKTMVSDSNSFPKAISIVEQMVPDSLRPHRNILGIRNYSRDGLGWKWLCTYLERGYLVFSILVSSLPS